MALMAAGFASVPAASQTTVREIDSATLLGTADESVFGAYLAGEFALKTGEIDAAAEAFRTAAAMRPNNDELEQRLFFLNVASGDVDAAVAQAENLLEAGSDFGEPRLLLAIAAIRDGRFEEALQQADQLDAPGLGSLLLPFVRAWATYGQGDAEAARALLEGSDDGALDTMRRFHRAALAALDSRPDEALIDLDAVMTGDGAGAPARIMQLFARVLIDAGRPEEARERLEQHLALYDDDIVREQLARLNRGERVALPFATPQAGTADAMLGLAEGLGVRNGGMQGLFFASLARYLAPENAESTLLIGEIYARLENYQAALTALETVPESAPQWWQAQKLRGEVLDAMGEVDQAADAFRQLAGSNPERIDPLIDLGNLYRRHERYAEAEPPYSEAIGKVPELENRHWRLLYFRGITYERTERWPEAEADFLKALELEPDQPFVLNYLGYSWVDQGLNLERALDMLTLAVDLRPEDGFIVDSLGWVYYRLGEFDKAVSYLERAVELQPGDPVINDHLGDAYWQVGRTREARFQWERALSLEPAEKEVPLIEAKLADGLSPPNDDEQL